MDEYLLNKRRKIQDNNAELEQISSLFKGKSFYLNGYLGEMGYGDFKLLILRRGGTVYDYLSTKVTHIIASTMTKSKLAQITKPIIRPDWILDCIAQERILSFHSYLLNNSNNSNIGFKPLETKVATDDSNNQSELDLDDQFIIQNTTLDPNFLSKFFSKSRLHHLTNWKQELIEYVNQKMKTRETHKAEKRWIMHVDLDAFFVSVSLLDYPHLKDFPVVIAHSSMTSDDSTSEIASCNYVSRRFGIYNGMRLAKAKTKCPDLHVLHYDFEKYRDVSIKFFDVLIQHADQIQVNSCDEALIDVSNRVESGRGVLELAEMIRNDVFKMTGKFLRLKLGGCTASVGCGSNMLLARLATHKAKPNGSFLVEKVQEEQFLDEVLVENLPGVGWSHQEKLSQCGILNCRDLRKLSLEVLQKDFGIKTGEMLYKFCRGIDDRELQNKERQSLGVDINWGVRFQNQTQVSLFFKQITQYVSERLRAFRLKASHITIKAKKRLYKGEPDKFLGCGHCENLSKSQSMPFTDNEDTLYTLGYSLLCKLSVQPLDLRGIGLSVKNFNQCDSVNSPTKRKGDRQATIVKYLSPVKVSSSKSITSTAHSNNSDKIDLEVFEQLPEEIQREIRGSIGLGFRQQTRFNSFATPKPKLRQNKSAISHLDASSPELMSNPGRSQMNDMQSIPSEYDPHVFKALPSSIQRELKAEHDRTKQKSKKELDMNNLLPSASQLDPSVVDELPESIKKEILGSKYKKRRDSIFVQKLRGAQNNLNITEFKPPEFLEVRNNIYPTLGGESDPFVVYDILNQWIISSPENPAEEGIKELKTYFQKLVDICDLIRIRNVLLYLQKRLLVFDGSNGYGSRWKAAYFELYSHAQQLTLKKYGANLDM